jgi:hypothetical protein
MVCSDLFQATVGEHAQWPLIHDLAFLARSSPAILSLDEQPLVGGSSLHLHQHKTAFELLTAKTEVILQPPSLVFVNHKQQARGSSPVFF